MYDVDFDHQFIETEKYDAKPTYKKFLGYRPGVAVIGDLIVGIENSDGNTNVRFHIIKNFKEKYSNLILGRIDAIKPGYYTRLGAAIRESTKILNNQKSANKLLLIVSDGKPNDVDKYDGRYGIEDTKKAIMEAKKKGITPFCVTIDLEAKDYLTHLFGKNGFVVIRDTKKLPKVLPEIYMNLTK